MTHTLCNERRDFPEWHQGRSHYAVWALALDTEAVRQRMRLAQQHLSVYLLDGYQRQPHVTLGLCGFPSTAPVLADDFGVPTLKAQWQALRTSGLQPFDIRIGGLHSFASVPYLQVDAPAGALQTLRRCLATAALNADAGSYLPHLTVGLYGGVWPLASLQALFQRFDAGPWLQLPINHIELLAYEASQIGGPLHRLARYDIANGNLHCNTVLPQALQAFAQASLAQFAATPTA